MKKLGLGIGTVFLMCAMSGCGGDTASTEMKPAPSPPDDVKALFKKPAKAPPAPGKGAFAPMSSPGELRIGVG